MALFSKDPVAKVEKKNASVSHRSTSQGLYRRVAYVGNERTVILL